MRRYNTQDVIDQTSESSVKLMDTIEDSCTELQKSLDQIFNLEGRTNPIFEDMLDLLEFRIMPVIHQINNYTKTKLNPLINNLRMLYYKSQGLENEYVKLSETQTYPNVVSPIKTLRSPIKSDESQNLRVSTLGDAFEKETADSIFGQSLTSKSKYFFEVHEIPCLSGNLIVIFSQRA